MATPAKKLKSEDSDPQSTSKDDSKPQAAPSILRLVKQSRQQQEGPTAEDAYRSQTEGSRNVASRPAPSALRLVKQSQLQGQGPQSQDTYQPQTVPKGFQAPPQPRSGAEGKAFAAGKKLGQFKSEAKDAALDKASAATGLDFKNLDLDKIAQQAEKGDMRGAVGEAATQLGVGKEIGSALFLIWGVLFFATGFTPVLGLFGGSGVMLIFNLLLVSPKLVYRLTEFILDLVGVGEALQAADKVGLSKTKITLPTWEKLAIVAMDIGFFLWHLIFIAIFVAYLCALAGFASNIPVVGSVLNLVAKGADKVTGIPVSGLREACQIIGATTTGGFRDANPNGIPGSGTCDIVENPASGCDAQRLSGFCNWDPKLASQVCNKESAGGLNPAIGGTADYCYPYGPDGKKLPMSIGYFQINIFNSFSPEFSDVCSNVLRNDGCWVDLVTLPGTNIKYCPKRKCSFGSGGEAGYNRCVQALSDGDRNTTQACNLYKQRGWQPWSAAKVCHIIN